MSRHRSYIVISTIKLDLNDVFLKAKHVIIKFKKYKNVFKELLLWVL